MSFKKTVYGIGYLGFGKFKCWDRDAGRTTEEHRAWAHMIRRVYDDKLHELRPWYKGMEVCEEWHDFQVFAEWYTSHRNYGLGFELDKDILSGRDKIYSPETCMLLPKEINASLIVKPTPKGKKLPTGVTRTKNKVVNRYRVRVRGLLPNELYCYANTVEEAAVKSLEAKDIRLMQLVERYKNYLDDCEIEAILNFNK